MEVASVGKNSAFVALCASGLASVYLIGVFRKLTPICRKKLLARQLLHLAVANLIFAAAEIQTTILDFGVAAALQAGGKETASQTGLLLAVCKANSASNEFGRALSLSLECHLAFAFVASTFKNTRVLDSLSRALPFVWPFALVVAFSSSLLIDDFWQGDEHGACGSHGPRWNILILVLMTFAICLFCFLRSAYRVHKNGIRLHKAGGIAQNSVWYRVQWYLLVAVLFTAPYGLYNATAAFYNDGAYKQAGDILFHITGTLYNLNGLLNAMVYALLSRHTRRLYRKYGMGLVPQLSFQSDESSYSYGVSFQSADSLQRDVLPPPANYFAEMFFDGKVQAQAPATGSPDNVAWAPQCLTCMQAMLWTIYLHDPDGALIDWSCRVCAAGSATGSSERWSCPACSDHLCGRCARMSQARAAASLSFNACITGSVQQACEIVKAPAMQAPAAQAPAAQAPCKQPDEEAGDAVVQHGLAPTPPAKSPLSMLNDNLKRLDQQQAIRAKIQAGLDLSEPQYSPRYSPRGTRSPQGSDHSGSNSPHSPSSSLSASVSNSFSEANSRSPERKRSRPKRH